MTCGRHCRHGALSGLRRTCRAGARPHLAPLADSGPPGARRCLDSRLIRSFRFLLFRPGTLTVAYLKRPRKPYIAPFRLFLLANLFFFAVQSFTTEKVFSTPLASHLQVQDWSRSHRNWSMPGWRQERRCWMPDMPTFDRAVAANAKSLVIVMAIPFALFLILMFRRAGRPAVAHIVFALALLRVSHGDLVRPLAGGARDSWMGAFKIRWSSMDTLSFALQLGAIAAYLYVAIGKVYGATGVIRAVKAATLAVAVGAVVLGYRFLIFLVTLYGTWQASGVFSWRKGLSMTIL